LTPLSFDCEKLYHSADLIVSAIEHFLTLNKKFVIERENVRIPIEEEEVDGGIAVPLQAEQGGINFAPIVLSFPYGWESAQKCLSVICPWVDPNYFLNRLSDWDHFFFTKIRENVYVEILISEFRGHPPRVKLLEQILAPN
jgi:hypothetical protein